MCYIKSPFDPYIDDPFRPYKQPIPYQPSQQPQTGWICPKCGRVNAPPNCGCSFDVYKTTCGTSEKDS